MSGVHHLHRVLGVATIAVAASALAHPVVAPLDDFRSVSTSCVAGRTHCFSIHLHVADDMIAPAWIGTQIAIANHHFAEVSASFKITRVDAHTMERVDTIAERASLKKYVTNGVIHVFVTTALRDVDEPDEEIRGVTLRKGDTKYIILSAIAPDRVLAHELGHLFGLKHSKYAISIMNKTVRAEPPIEQRTFAPEEIVKLASGVKRLVRAGVLTSN
jgi:hypothetical protein